MLRLVYWDVIACNPVGYRHSEGICLLPFCFAVSPDIWRKNPKLRLVVFILLKETSIFDFTFFKERTDVELLAYLRVEGTSRRCFMSVLKFRFHLLVTKSKKKNRSVGSQSHCKEDLC
jgi:hypothetical protein